MKLGFVGMGNMASAILLGALRAGYLKADEVVAYDVLPQKLEEMAAATGIGICHSVGELAGAADLLMMAVKPNNIEDVVAEAGEKLAGKAILSIAAGWDFARYEKLLRPDTRVLFVMPNTPCMVGEGMTLFEKRNSLTEAEFTFAKGLFESIGSVEVLDGKLMDVGGTLSGCGPAFLYVLIEALADGAVYHGLPRETAYRLASQMVLGAGKMGLESGLHPGKLKDNVCSPGGTTIRGVRALENKGFRSALIDAVDAAVGKK